ncbi:MULTISPECIES: hypothetical protein [unclassified Streptomyces]|uniref:hypothetical protein n=1 Tax=unclassified Streptomyces TaxID=2593676 RepID=UPI0033286FA8
MRVDPQEPPHAEEQSEQKAESTPELPCPQEPSDEEEPLPESCDDDRFEPL